MSEEIYVDPTRLEEQTLSAEKLVEKMKELVPEVNKLSFGSSGTKGSTGPYADKMTILTSEFATSISLMAETMQQLLSFVRNGAENIVEMDSFLATQTAKVGVTSTDKDG
jgi:hypothetical protein